MKEDWSSLSTGKKIRLVGAVLLGILVITFAIMNWKDKEVSFLFTTIRVPLTIIILISGAGGFALASLFNYQKFRKRDKEIKQLKSKLKELSN